MVACTVLSVLALLCHQFDVILMDKKWSQCKSWIDWSSRGALRCTSPSERAGNLSCQPSATGCNFINRKPEMKWHQAWQGPPLLWHRSSDPFFYSTLNIERPVLLVQPQIKRCSTNNLCCHKKECHDVTERRGTCRPQGRVIKHYLK